MWTAKAVAPTAAADPKSAVEAHLGANFPIILTTKTATVEGKLWYEAKWQTPGRTATGWLPAEAVVEAKPTAEATADIDSLDEELSEFLDSYGTRVGVAVYDVTRGITYGHNADRPYYVASSMKVPIMFTLLSQLEAAGKRPTGHQMSLLATMIENSNNRSATALYDQIDAEKGVKAFLKKYGLSGLKPNDAAHGWGYSTVTPLGMVALLRRLNAGTILDATDRATAVRLMTHVTPHQRVGVGDSSPAAATVALKDGWIDVHDGRGPFVMNSSGIVTLGGETYILAVYTDQDRSYGAGFKIVRHVCDIVGKRLTGPEPKSDD